MRIPCSRSDLLSVLHVVEDAEPVYVVAQFGREVEKAKVSKDVGVRWLQVYDRGRW